MIYNIEEIINMGVPSSTGIMIVIAFLCLVGLFIFGELLFNLKKSLLDKSDKFFYVIAGSMFFIAAFLMYRIEMPKYEKEKFIYEDALHFYIDLESVYTKNIYKNKEKINELYNEHRREMFKKEFK